MGNRNSLQITSAILEAAKDSGQQGIKITTLITKSNLSHPRLTAFVKNLTGTGLMEKIEYDGKNTFIITEKGRNYLQEYQKFANIAGVFGLEL